MKKLLKILGVLAGVGALLLVIGAVAIRYFLPPEKIKALIEQQAAAALHRQVKLGAVSVGMLNGLELNEVALSEAPDFSKGTFFSAEKITVRPRLLPLLAKKFLINNFSLIKPQVAITRLADGKTYNFSDLTGGSQAGKSSASGPLTFLVSRAHIEQGAVQILDKSGKGLGGVGLGAGRSPDSITLKEVDLRNLTMAGPIVIDAALTSKINGLEIEVNLSGVVRPLSGSAELKKLALASGASKISVQGKVENMTGASPEIDLNLGIQNVDPALFASWALLPKDTTLRGPLSGRVGVRGTAAAMDLSSQLDFTKTAINKTNVFRKAAGVPMETKLSGRLTNKADLAISELVLSLASFSLKGKGNVKNLPDPGRTFSLEMQSNEFVLSDLLSALPSAALPPEVKMSGNGSFSVNYSGTDSNGVVAFLFDGSPLDLSYGTYFKKTSGHTLKAEAKGHYSTPTSVEFSQFKLTLGQMELAGPGKYKSLPKGSESSFQIKSNSFPLDDLARTIPMLLEYRPGGNASVNANVSNNAQSSMALGVLSLQGAALHYEQSELSKLTSAIDFTMDSAATQKLTGKLNGSDLTMSFSAKKIQTHPVVNAAVQVALLDLGKLIPKGPAVTEPPKKTDAGFLVQIADAAEGTPKPGAGSSIFDFAGSLTAGEIVHEYLKGQNLKMSWNLTDITADLARLNGTANLQQGKGEVQKIQKLTEGSGAARVFFTPLTLLQKLDKSTKGLLKLPTLDHIAFKAITGDYIFHAGTMEITKFNVNSTEVAADMTGTVGLAGAQPVNLKAVLKLPPGSVGGSVGEFLQDSEGRTTLTMLVKGTVAEPEVKLDTSEAKKKAVESLKESVTKDGAEKLQGLLKGLLKK